MKFFKKILDSTLLRYGVAGGSASLFDVGLFNVLIYFGGTYYIVAAIVSNTISFFIRFFLQKHYAFRSSAKEGMHRQLFIYGIWFATGLLLTSFFLFIFVDYFKINPSISQILAILVVAILSFFIYRHVIFPEKKSVIRKLLIFTQKADINDPVLGFFHKWIEEFSKNFESIIVVCLEKGEFNFNRSFLTIFLQLYSIQQQQQQQQQQLSSLRVTIN